MAAMCNAATRAASCASVPYAAPSLRRTTIPANVKSRWPKEPAEQSKAKAPDSSIKRGAKQVASKTLDAAGPGVTIGTKSAAFATGGTAALYSGAAAASATGIGLIVVGGLLTLGASAKSIVAARSSKHHRDVLQKIEQRKREFQCMIPPGTSGEPDYMAHQRIGVYVLPYAIEQKDKKYTRKAIGSVPVLGSIPMKIHQLWRAGTKENKGVQRNEMAYELAVHLITHNCALAQAMVAELFSSYEKMLWMLDQDTNTISPLIAEKLKSV